MNKDMINGTLEVIYKARYYFLISLIFSIYVSINSNSMVGFLTNMVLNSFSAVIGVNETMIELIKKVNFSSKRINEIHFNKLMIDTDFLKSIHRSLKDGDKSTEVLVNIETMISNNTQTINAIKAAMNGVER